MRPFTSPSLAQAVAYPLATPEAHSPRHASAVISTLDTGMLEELEELSEQPTIALKSLMSLHLPGPPQPPSVRCARLALASWWRKCRGSLSVLELRSPVRRSRARWSLSVGRAIMCGELPLKLSSSS